MRGRKNSRICVVDFCFTCFRGFVFFCERGEVVSFFPNFLVTSFFLNIVALFFFCFARKGGASECPLPSFLLQNSEENQQIGLDSTLS